MAFSNNTQIVRRLLDEVFSQGKYDVIDQLVAPDCIEHQNGVQGIGIAAVLGVATGATILTAAPAH